MAKNNTIFWIIGIVLIAVIILPKLDTGLFVAGETCVSNEPDTLEGYKTMIESSSYLDYLTPCAIEQDGKIISCYWEYKTEFYIDSRASHFNDEEYTCHEYFDFVKEIYPESFEVYKGKEIFNGVYTFFCTKNNYQVIMKADQELRNQALEDYFDTFYTCEADEELDDDEEPSVWIPEHQYCTDVWIPVCGIDGKTYSNTCYANLAGVEVDYGGECKEKWYNKELFPIGDFIIKLWMLLAGLGAILLIYISTKK